jgi:rhodanese-related sulfurtransferase
MDKIVEFTGNHLLLVLALVASFLLVLFVEIRRKASGVLSIGPADAVALMNKDAMVLDLRSVEAFNRGHIVNARNIPHDELDAKLGKLGNLEGKTVVAVCDAGINSAKAAQKLRQAGVQNAYGLKGGMNGWTQDGMPVVTGKKMAAPGKPRKSKG